MANSLCEVDNGYERVCQSFMLPHLCVLMIYMLQVYPVVGMSDNPYTPDACPGAPDAGEQTTGYNWLSGTKSDMNPVVKRFQNPVSGSESNRTSLPASRVIQ